MGTLLKKIQLAINESKVNEANIGDLLKNRRKETVGKGETTPDINFLRKQLDSGTQNFYISEVGNVYLLYLKDNVDNNFLLLDKINLDLTKVGEKIILSHITKGIDLGKDNYGIVLRLDKSKYTNINLSKYNFEYIKEKLNSQDIKRPKGTVTFTPYLKLNCTFDLRGYYFSSNKNVYFFDDDKNKVYFLEKTNTNISDIEKQTDDKPIRFTVPINGVDKEGIFNHNGFIKQSKELDGKFFDGNKINDKAKLIGSFDEKKNLVNIFL